MESFGLITDLFDALTIFYKSGLFFDEIKHGLVSLFFAGIFYYKTKNIKLSGLIIFITYAIDSDHLVDYLLYYGANDFTFSKFIALDYFEITKRAVVPFHAWEWVLFLGLLAHEQTKKHRLLLSAIATGIFSHLVWDMATVGSLKFYSIIYRISLNFIALN